MSNSSLRIAFVVASLAGASVVACGLSLFVDAADPPPADASVANPDGSPPVAEDGAVLPLPDGALPNEPDASDAGRDAISPIRDAGTAIDAMPPVTCTPVLTETFGGTTDAGLAFVGGAKIANGKLEVLARDATRTQAGAYLTMATPLESYAVKFTVSTGAIGRIYTKTDGFAFSALEKALPAAPALRPGNDLGVTLQPAMQHGYGLIVDITPPFDAVAMRPEDRYVGSNELGPTPRDVRELLPFGYAFEGATSFDVTMLTIGDGKTYYQVTSAAASALHAVPYRTGSPATTQIRTLLFSAATSAVGVNTTAPSPGFYVDDLVVSTCTSP